MLGKGFPPPRVVPTKVSGLVRSVLDEEVNDVLPYRKTDVVSSTDVAIFECLNVVCSTP